MSPILHNRKEVLEKRRRLRQTQTRPEILFWSRVRNNKLGYKFKRQHSIGPYIVDFYCAQLHLVIELDGPLHFEEERIQKDKIREEFLKKFGFNIVRFHTQNVMDDIETIILNLKSICINLSSSL